MTNMLAWFNACGWRTRRRGPCWMCRLRMGCELEHVTGYARVVSPAGVA